MERRPMTDRAHPPSVNITGPRSRGRAISITVMHCTFQTRVGVPARVPVLLDPVAVRGFGLTRSRRPVPSDRETPLTGSAGEDRVREARPHER